MFSGCKSFNQDISKWDVSKVEHNDDMFEDCSIKEKYKPKFK
jgi:surface protein